MAKPLPTICGDSQLYIPEQDCSECDRLQGQIDELKEDVKELDQKIDDTAKEINERIDNEVETLNNTITTLRNDMEQCCNEVKQSITNLSERVTENAQNIENLSAKIDSVIDTFQKYEDLVITKHNDDGTVDEIHVLGYVSQYEPPDENPYFVFDEDEYRDTINVGDTFDPREGVTAYDYEGNEIDYTVTGEIDVNTPGEYELTYTATDSEGRTVTETQTITVVEDAITWTGLDDLTVSVGEEFDPLEGVSAIGCNDEPAEITVDTGTQGNITLNFRVAENTSGNYTQAGTQDFSCNDETEYSDFGYPQSDFAKTNAWYIWGVNGDIVYWGTETPQLDVTIAEQTTVLQDLITNGYLECGETYDALNYVFVMPSSGGGDGGNTDGNTGGETPPPPNDPPEEPPED